MRKKNENLFEWSYFLDDKKEDLLTVKYILSENGEKVIEFVIIYTTIIDEIPKEVIKYDTSQKEKTHAHYNYQNPPKKVFIQREVSIETVLELVKYIENNWRKMKLKFMEK